MKIINNKLNNKLSIIIISIFLIISIFNFNLIYGNNYDENNYDENSYNLLEKYYSTFEQFDLEGYLSTQDLRSYSNKEIEIKKHNINLMWENVEPISHNIYNLNTEINENIKLVTYELDAVVGNYKNNNFNYSMKMIAIFSNINNTWKILKIMPLIQYDELVEYINIEKSLIKLNQSLNDGFINQSLNKINLTKNNSLKPEILNFKIENNSKKINCEFDINSLNYIKNINIKEFVSDKIYNLLIGNFGINLIISKNFNDDNNNKNNKFIIEINNGNLKLVNKTSKTIKYNIYIDECTISAIKDKSISPMDAYNQNLIIMKGETIGSKIKLTLGKIVYSIFNFFKSEEKVNSIILEGENFELLNKGKYDYVGPSSRSKGELYLGTGRSSAKIKFNSEKQKKVFIYIKINDDKKHRNGARSVDIYFNKQDSNFNSTINYNHKSINTITPKSFWTWKYIGEVNIKKGENEIEIFKPKQTSAAFIMDKIGLFDNKIDSGNIKE